MTGSIKRRAAYTVEDGLTVAEVADRCGFANPQHFSKAFVRRFREMPRRYRLRAWEGKPLEIR